MFNSHSESSDDDPDFDLERNKKRGSASWLIGRDAALSSDEVGDPEENSDRKKKPRKESTPKTPSREPGTGKRPVGRPRKNSTSPNEPSAPKSRGRPRKNLTSTPTSTSPGQQTPGPSSSGAPEQVAASPTTANGLSQAPVVYQPGFPVVEPVRRPPGEFEYFCCVRGCESRDTSNKEGLWLFSLPEEPEAKRIWEERLRIDHHRNRPKSPRVCFRHFDRDDYVGRRQRLTGLRQGALPKVETTEHA